MADPKAQGADDQEPSMEEILSSIRRIIAEDDKKEAAAPAPLPPDSGSDVFELTEMVTEDGEVESLGEPSMPTAPPADVLASIDDALATPPLTGQSAIDSMFDDAPAPPPEPVAAAAPPPVPKPQPPIVEVPAMTESNVPSEDEEQLLSEQAAAVSSAALKKLVPPKKPPPPGEPVIPFRAGLTVEDLVQDMLRPMMKEWLDKNLPPIVQHIVEKEIKKLTSD